MSGAGRARDCTGTGERTEVQRVAVRGRVDQRDDGVVRQRALRVPLQLAAVDKRPVRGRVADRDRPRADRAPHGAVPVRDLAGRLGVGW